MSREQDLEAELEQASLEFQAAQEMLAHVLAEVGEPVVVTKERIKEGFPPGTQVAVTEDLENESFTFALTNVDFDG